MKKLLLTGFGLMAAASAAMGEEVQATKKAAIMTPIENLYGRIEARQTSLEWSQSDGQVQRNVTAYSLRPRLGTKMFKNRLDTYVETPIAIQSRTSNFSQGQSLWVMQYAALESQNFYITPYTESMLANQSKPFTTKAALNFDANASVRIIGGEFSFHGGIEPQMAIGTRESKTSLVAREEGKIYSLVSEKDGKFEATQKEPTSTLEYIGGIGFKPNFAPKFSLTADVYFDRTYNPTYKAVVDDNGERLEKTGYAISDATTTDVILNYAADRLTSVQSRTLIFNDGLYASAPKGQGSPRIQQRLSLIHKLF